MAESEEELKSLYGLSLRPEEENILLFKDSCDYVV